MKTTTEPKTESGRRVRSILRDYARWKRMMDKKYASNLEPFPSLLQSAEDQRRQELNRGGQ